jgi:acetyltransferase-like isoleucine patch superfamily enzyme
MALWERLKAAVGAHPPSQTAGGLSPLPSGPSAPIAQPAEPDLPRLASGLDHGAPFSDALREALDAAMRLRRVRNALADGPASPRFEDLRVVRAGLPSWWAEGGNLLLAGEGGQPPDLRFNPFLGPPRRAVVAVGGRGRFDHVNLSGESALVAIGDGVIAPAGAISCYGLSTILIGERTTCTNWAMIDCRNGGIVVVGADGMWAHGVSVLSDDTHAIRDAQTGARLNAFGGRILIGEHVWLCEQVRVMGGARIGADAIVGAGALVKNRSLEPNTVGVGVPVRPVRSGVTWSREDVP